MFEGYVVYYLNQYLGKYVDGIDQKSLRCACPSKPAASLVRLLPLPQQIGNSMQRSSVISHVAA